MHTKDGWPLELFKDRPIQNAVRVCVQALKGNLRLKRKYKPNDIQYEKQPVAGIRHGEAWVDAMGLDAKGARLIGSWLLRYADWKDEQHD